MRWLCPDQLSRAVALVLLLWTAADLSNSNLCPLDNEGASGLASHSGTTLSPRTGGSLPPEAPPHIDDCFCCSHCVEPSALLPVAVAMDIDLREPRLVAMVPSVFGSPLYHPPLASLQ